MATQPFLSVLCLILLDVIHVAKMIYEVTIMKMISCVKHYDYTSGDKESAKLSSFFKGKTVLITGASSGLGKAMALKIAQCTSTENEPAHMVLSSRSVDKLEEVAYQCKCLSPKSTLIVIPLDMAELTDESGGRLENYMTELEKKLKEHSLQGIDCLIGNAGVSSRGTALDTSDEVLRSVMNVNFFGPVALTKAIAKDMCKRSAGGSISVVSSVQGKLGLPLRSSYSSSKHALQGYFDSIRGELSLKGIGVNVISPGYINTNLSINAVTATGEKYGVSDMTTQNGMSSESAARLTLVAIANENPDFIMADAKTVAAIQGRIQFPNLLAKFMNQRAKNSKT